MPPTFTTNAPIAQKMQVKCIIVKVFMHLVIFHHVTSTIYHVYLFCLYFGTAVTFPQFRVLPPPSKPNYTWYVFNQLKLLLISIFQLPFHLYILLFHTSKFLLQVLLSFSCHLFQTLSLPSLISHDTCFTFSDHISWTVLSCCILLLVSIFVFYTFSCSYQKTSGAPVQCKINSYL